LENQFAPTKDLKMKQTVLMFACFACLASFSMAALPPLTFAELQQKAAVIVHAQVNRVFHRVATTEKTPSFADDQYSADIDVFQIFKNLPAVLRPFESLTRATTIHYWHKRERPDHFAGPTGQAMSPVEGNEYVFFLANALEPKPASVGTDISGIAHQYHVLDLLQPNGIMTLEAWNNHSRENIQPPPHNHEVVITYSANGIPMTSGVIP
jgi:hypothetical protein